MQDGGLSMDVIIETRSPCRLIAIMNNAKLALESGQFDEGETSIKVSFRTGVGGANIQAFASRVGRVIYGPSNKVRLDPEDKTRYEVSSINSDIPACYLKLSGRIVSCESTFPIVLEASDIKV